MVGKNWRDRLHEKRPKTPVQPTTVAGSSTQANPGNNNNPIVEHNRPQLSENVSKRRTYHGSRPQTPLLAATMTSTSGGDELDTNQDIYSDTGTDTTTGRRKSGQRPKLSRYISDYLFLSNAQKDSDVFSEPWNENTRPLIEPPPDPLITLQAVRSHIAHIPSKPLPTEHNSGILHIFEDYRKVREGKERLDALMQETLEDYKLSEAAWAATEDRYQEEIRRLELIIAQGKSGMETLVKARQGSVVDRKRTHRRTVATDQTQMVSGFLTRDQIDEQIRLQCQRVVFQRPTSPSSTMAVLSRQFYDPRQSEELPIGTLPDGQPKWTLSRKVKSELELNKMTNRSPPNAQPPSTCSGFSISGDPMLDGLDPAIAFEMEPGVECEAFVALRDLATLVARRRGIDATTVVSGLITLLSATDEPRKDEGVESEPDMDNEDTIQFIGPMEVNENTNETPGHILRRYQSQPHFMAGYNRGRHFSFEPGDDQLGILHQELQRSQFDRAKSPAGSQSTRSSELQDPNSDALSEGSMNESLTLTASTPKPSKIPGPLNHPSLSHARRENSNSSLLTVTRLRLEDRQNFKSSIPKSSRENSSGNLRQPQSASRSDSSNILHQAKTT